MGLKGHGEVFSCLRGCRDLPFGQDVHNKGLWPLGWWVACPRWVGGSPAAGAHVQCHLRPGASYSDTFNNASVGSSSVFRAGNS